MEEDTSAADGCNCNFRYARKLSLLLLEAKRQVYNISIILDILRSRDRAS